MTAILTVAVTVFAAAPPPATQSAEQLEQWLTQLADDDPAVRDAARVNLMGLSRAELDTLRRVVEEHAPLAPGQSAALQDIVCHVYLAGEPRPQNIGVGFLGVSLADMYQPAAGGADEQAEAPPREAVLVTSTLAGFAGHRYLQAGD